MGVSGHNSTIRSTSIYDAQQYLAHSKNMRIVCHLSVCLFLPWIWEGYVHTDKEGLVHCITSYEWVEEILEVLPNIA